MSREFGEYYSGGYFHDKISYAAEDCKEGRDQLTRLWGEFLEEFKDVAYQISNSEAADSGPDAPISETIMKMPALKRKLDAIEGFILPYQRVAQEAVRKALEKTK